MSSSVLKVLPLLFLLITMPAFAGMDVIDGTPAGFEQLDTPRPTMVSLYYGGNFLGSFAAHASPATLQFDQPDTIVEIIPSIRDKALLLAGLKKHLPINADKLCNAKRIENCGTLSPDNVGVIFSENNLSAELFINRDNLIINENEETRYLPLPERKFSSIYMFNGAVNGADQQDLNYSVSNNAIFSFGEGRMNVQSSLADQGLRFDTAEVSIERKGWESSAGLFRTRPMQLVGDIDIAGLSYGTSMRTVSDQNKTQGNDIILYLPRRSFVSIYREGRLYSSRAYEAGNQSIDTSDLPEGAYTITLRIQEADGQTREETRFFAKNQEIPPIGHPTYYLQGGVVREVAFSDETIPQLTAKPILRMGTVRRVSDNIGLGLSMTGIQDRAATEAGIYWIRSGTQLRMTALASSKSDVGYNVNYFYTNEKISAALDIRQLWSSQDTAMEYQNLFMDIRQASSTIAYAIDENKTIGARASFSAQDQMPDSITIGPYAQWRMWQSGESSLELNADFARSNNRNQGDIFIRFTRRFGNYYGVTGTVGNRFGNGASPIGNVRGWYEKNSVDRYLQLGAGVSADKTNQIISTDADWRNHVGQLRGSVQQSTGSAGSGLGYGGNFSINAAQLAHHVHVGGMHSDKSAILVHAKGEPGIKMRIFINGSAQGTVKTGDSRVIYLTPFHSYNIRLAPEKPSLLDYESNDKKVTLYPGNVANLEWHVNYFYVVAAQIIDEAGQPLANAALQESRTQITTRENGRLQAELSKPEELHFTKQDKQQCLVTLPKDVEAVNGVLIYKEPLPCINQTSSLPSADHPISHN